MFRFLSLLDRSFLHASFISLIFPLPLLIPSIHSFFYLFFLCFFVSLFLFSSFLFFFVFFLFLFRSQLNDLSSSKAAGSGFFTIVDDVSFAICQVDVLIDQLNSLIGEIYTDRHVQIHTHTHAFLHTLTHMLLCAHKPCYTHRHKHTRPHTSAPTHPLAQIHTHTLWHTSSNGHYASYLDCVSHNLYYLLVAYCITI